MDLGAGHASRDGLIGGGGGSCGSASSRVPHGMMRGNRLFAVVVVVVVVVVLGVGGGQADFQRGWFIEEVVVDGFLVGGGEARAEKELD